MWATNFVRCTRTFVRPEACAVRPSMSSIKVCALTSVSATLANRKPVVEAPEDLLSFGFEHRVKVLLGSLGLLPGHIALDALLLQVMLALVFCQAETL